MRIHSKCIENKKGHEIVVVVHLFRYSFHPKHHVKFSSIKMNCFVHHHMDCDVKEFISCNLIQTKGFYIFHVLFFILIQDHNLGG